MTSMTSIIILLDFDFTIQSLKSVLHVSNGSNTGGFIFVETLKIGIFMFFENAIRDSPFINLNCRGEKD